jgi:hypothetical protein
MFKKIIIIVIFIIIFIFRIFFYNIEPFYIANITCTIKRFFIVSIFLYSLLSFINLTISFMLGNSKGIFQLFKQKLLNLLIYEPLDTFIEWCLTFKMLHQCLLKFGLTLLKIFEAKAKIKFFFFLYFICPRLVFIYSFYIDIFVLEQINIILKNIFIISLPLITLFFIYATYLTALKEKTTLEKYFVHANYCSEKNAIILSPTGTDTSSLHYSSWDKQTFIIDRCLYFISLMQTLFFRCFQYLILILILILYFQYISLFPKQ